VRRTASLMAPSAALSRSFANLGENLLILSGPGLSLFAYYSSLVFQLRVIELLILRGANGKCLTHTLTVKTARSFLTLATFMQIGSNAPTNPIRGLGLCFHHYLLGYRFSGCALDVLSQHRL